MINPKPMRVCFIRVTDNASKLQKLCEIVHSHFIKKDQLLITVPSSEAATYIDQLLWKMPEESFIPHLINNSLSKDPIIITTNTTNINQAKTVINLLVTVHPNPVPADLLYELLDLTSKDKEAISKRKQSDYHNAGFLIEEL